MESKQEKDRKIGELTSRVAYLEYSRQNDLLHMRNTDRRLNRVERSLDSANLLLPAKADERLEQPKIAKPDEQELAALDGLFPDETSLVVDDCGVSRRTV
jgi:hypothetical protein